MQLTKNTKKIENFSIQSKTLLDYIDWVLYTEEKYTGFTIDSSKRDFEIFDTSKKDVNFYKGIFFIFFILFKNFGIFVKFYMKFEIGHFLVSEFRKYLYQKNKNKFCHLVFLDHNQLGNLFY